MQLTEEKIGLMLDRFIAIAKDQRNRIPYSKDEHFPSLVILLGPFGEMTTIPAQWSTNGEKYRFFKAVSYTAQKTLTTAVALISDSRSVKGDDKFSAFIGIEPIEKIGLEAWREAYNRILNARYAGEVKNLPREFWTDSICVVMKGPGIKPVARLQNYGPGPNDSIAWGEQSTQKDNTLHFNLLPDWWC
jgi:hypothetical protein